MKQVKFEELGINATFRIESGKQPARWASKIDPHRYIFIGENGSHHPEPSDLFFIEDAQQ